MVSMTRFWATSRRSSSCASASAATVASLSTNTGTPSRSPSTARKRHVDERDVDRGDDPAADELDDRGHPDPDARELLVAHGLDHLRELFDERLGALSSRSAGVVDSLSRSSRRTATAIFVPPRSTPMTELTRRCPAGQERSGGRVEQYDELPGARRAETTRARGDRAGAGAERGGDGLRLTLARGQHDDLLGPGDGAEGEADPGHERLETGLRHRHDEPRALLDGGLVGKQRRSVPVRADAEQQQLELGRAGAFELALVVLRPGLRVRARPSSGAPRGWPGPTAARTAFSRPCRSSSARRRVDTRAHRRTRSRASETSASTASTAATNSS